MITVFLEKLETTLPRLSKILIKKGGDDALEVLDSKPNHKS